MNHFIRYLKIVDIQLNILYIANYFRKIKPWKRTESGFILGKFVDYTNYYFKIENQGNLKKQNEVLQLYRVVFQTRQIVLWELDIDMDLEN